MYVAVLETRGSQGSATEWTECLRPFTRGINSMCALVYVCVHTNVCVRVSELPGAGGALLALGVPASGESKYQGPVPALGA